MNLPPRPESGDQPLADKTEIGSDTDHERPPQLSLAAILAIWCAAAIPMPVLAFAVAPALAERTGMMPGIALLLCMIAGMMWQFVLAICLLQRERRLAGGRAHWRDQVWWRSPAEPGTGRRRPVLLLWVIPILGATFLIEATGIGGLLARWLELLVPALADVPVPDIKQLVDPALHGAWWLIPVMLTACLFNYALGEALLFHGYLMPRMQGAFGRLDWLWNGVLFGGYHLIRPLTIPSIMLTGMIWAYVSIRYRSSQIAVYTHAVDALFVMGLTIGVVTGTLP